MSTAGKKAVRQASGKMNRASRRLRVKAHGFPIAQTSDFPREGKSLFLKYGFSE
jgi:hypothetical protein